MTSHVSQARLDELWRFDDPAESERRFREELTRVAAETVVAAELTTQLARALGLQERFVEAAGVLDGIANGNGIVIARILLERGRLRNSSGHPDEAIPLFEEALAAASAEGDDFLTVDAAHMLAIADAEHTARWTTRALETVDETTDARTKRWAVSLHNNLGWWLFDAGNQAAGLAELELAADAARDYGTPKQQQWAQEAIDEARTIISKPAD